MKACRVLIDGKCYGILAYDLTVSRQERRVFTSKFATVSGAVAADDVHGCVGE